MDISEVEVVSIVSSPTPEPSVSLNRTQGTSLEVVKVSPDFKVDQSRSIPTKTSPILSKEVEKSFPGRPCYSIVRVPVIRSIFGRPQENSK